MGQSLNDKNVAAAFSNLEKDGNGTVNFEGKTVQTVLFTVSLMLT